MKRDILNVYFPIIHKHYPTAKKEEVEVLSGAYAHIVLKIYNQIFRFAKTEDSERNIDVESTFSKRFSPISPIPIPVITNHHDATSGIVYQTYRFISGVPFTKEVASRLEENELVANAELLGEFLTKLHAFPVEEAKSLSMNSTNTSEEYARYFIDIIKEDKKLIHSLLTQQEWEWVEKNTEMYYALCRDHPFQLHVTHADLIPRHILLDEKTHRLSGIIDFSLKIGDPATDFRYFDRYGDVFLKTVYDNYLKRDPYFDERRNFHAGDFLVGHLYLTAQHKEEHEQKRTLKELQEYIATHQFAY